MRQPLGVAIAVLTLGACMVGPSIDSFPSATGPQGIAVDLHLKKVRVNGELLAAEDTAVVLLRDQRVVLVPLKDIVGGTFQSQGLMIQGGRYLSAGAAERLRLLARFPAGLPPEGWAALLQAYGQTAPDPAVP